MEILNYNKKKKFIINLWEKLLSPTPPPVYSIYSYSNHLSILPTCQINISIQKIITRIYIYLSSHISYKEKVQPNQSNMVWMMLIEFQIQQSSPSSCIKNHISGIKKVYQQKKTSNNNNHILGIISQKK